MILQVIDAFMMSDANNPMQDSVQVDSFLVCWTDSKLRFLLFPALGLCRLVASREIFEKPSFYI